MKFTIALIGLLVTGGWTMAATFPQDYSKILLPVVIPNPVDGAFDAEWLTHVVGAQVVRAEVTPAEGETFPFWALASTTNNVTHQITAFSPR